jgi:thiol-disulfide isomerase/thioredoxin
MRVLLSILMALCFECSIAAGSGSTGVKIDAQTYARIILNPGLPNFKPLTRWLVANARFAEIPVAQKYGRVCVCIGSDSSGVQRVVAINFKTDSSVTVSAGAKMEGIGSDTLRGHYDFQLLPSQSSAFPLAFLVVPSRDEFIYRWSQSVEDGSTPGGFPTPISSAIELGKSFPKVKVSLLNGGRRDLVALDGRICVINWWWTRCSACIQEMPGLNTLVEKYKGQVDFVAVTSDSKKDLTPFLNSRKFSYLQTIADSSAFDAFGHAAPRNVVLNKGGIVVFDDTGGGSETYKTIEAVIQRELNR